MILDGFFRLGIPIHAGIGIWKHIYVIARPHFYVLAKVGAAIHDTLLANFYTPVALTSCFYIGTPLFVLELLLYSIAALCIERFEIITTVVGFLVSAYKLQPE